MTEHPLLSLGDGDFVVAMLGMSDESLAELPRDVAAQCRERYDRCRPSFGRTERPRKSNGEDERWEYESRQRGDGAQPAAKADGVAYPDQLEPEALHGIAGEFVRMVEPVTEADRAAILSQFLVSFGALVGRGPHYRVEDTKHHANLFALLVGKTSKARKGTSWDRVRSVFEEVEGWKPHVSGLSSGEGLKYHVRDELTASEEKAGMVVTKVVDPGVTDKRLLVTESEFCSVLRVVQRPGNTLSPTVREFWDSGNARNLTKNDPITATNAHVCIIGHITADELRLELTATDIANGFANRFVFVAVRRSKYLPHSGGKLNEAEVGLIRSRLRTFASQARTRGQVGMSEPAMRRWEEVYSILSEGGEGMHGSVTARAEAQVVRIALHYALLDGAERIDVVHLNAALALWRYCDATAMHIFGSALGNPTADEIIRALRVAGDRGMTRTGIRDLFKRHRSAEQIQAALDLLKRRDRVTCETVSTEGRPFELWKATK